MLCIHLWLYFLFLEKVVEESTVPVYGAEANMSSLSLPPLPSSLFAGLPLSSSNESSRLAGTRHPLPFEGKTLSIFAQKKIIAIIKKNCDRNGKNNI